MNRMLRLATLSCAATLATAAFAPAHADGDRAEEARYQTRRAAAQAAARQRAAEDKARADKAQADFERKYVGKPADGKSDAEVHALYDKKIADAKARGEAAKKAMPGLLAQAQEAQKRANDPSTKAKADAGARMMGAKSMQDMANMSEADLVKLQVEMERKYGRP